MRTAFLLTIMNGLAVWFGYVLADSDGLLIALVIAVPLSGWRLFTAADRAIRLANAREVTEPEEPSLIAVVRTLAVQAGIPTPLVFITDYPDANAFSVGWPSRSAIIVTESLLYDAGLTPQEVAGVLAHELAHIRNRDMLTNAAAVVVFDVVLGIAGFAALIGMALWRKGGAAMIAFAAVAIVTGAMLRLAIGREREFAADRIGAEICGHPEWLASALRKLDSTQREAIDVDRLAMAPAQFIDPLPASWWAALLQTHPSTRRRIARLEAMQQRG